MNMISHFNNILVESFNKYLSKYFSQCNYYSKTSSFTNYYSFMNDLDNFSDSCINNLIKSYFEYIDNFFQLFLSKKLLYF